MTQALGITTYHTGESLSNDLIWVEDQGLSFPPSHCISSPRIGIAYAKEDALRPWRFCLKNPDLAVASTKKELQSR